MSDDAIILAPAGAIEILTPVMDLAVARQRLRQFQEFVKDYLVEEEDFGTIPGTNKPTLFKPGADKLCEIYGLSDSYAIISKVEDFDKGLFDYTIECSLTQKRYGVLVSQGLGSCNSYEGKYRWREGKRLCPECGKETIIKGKQEYGGGWLCWKNKGGCGFKWPDGAKEIEGQNIEKVLNDDVATLKNTILKMAKKRSKIDAALSATRSSGIFTQDIEDFPHGDTEGEKTPTVAEEKKAEQRIEEKNGLITLIGTVTQKAKGSGGVVMCTVKTEAGDMVLLRMESTFADGLAVNGQIKATAKRLPTSGDVRMYQFLELESDLTGILQESVKQAQEKLQNARIATESTQGTEPLPAQGKLVETPSNAPQTSSSGKVISDKQLKRLFAMAHEVWPDKDGVSVYERKVREMAGTEGFEHVHELTVPAYNRICDELTNLKLGV